MQSPKLKKTYFLSVRVRAFVSNFVLASAIALAQDKTLEIMLIGKCNNFPDELKAPHFAYPTPISNFPISVFRFFYELFGA